MHDPTKTSEIFSDNRMQRCIGIQRLIMDNFQKTRIYSCEIRATEPGETATIDEMRSRYFAIGLPGNTTEVPFLDLMVVLSMIEQEYAALLAAKNLTKFQVKFVITTDWPDQEAMRLLKQAQIQTLDNPDKLLQVLEVPSR